MSSSLPTTHAEIPAALRGTHFPDTSAQLSLPNWLREPLLHFIVLGGLLFAVDHFLVGRADDPRTIIVGPDVDSEAVEVFEASRARKPNADELAALHRVWLDNEVLYREGLALQVDKGDSAIRERVIFKALTVIDASVKLPQIDDKQLRAWFESHRAKYDEPARYNFQEAVLSGDTSEAAVRSFVAALNAGAPSDAQAGLRVFKDRPLANLVQSYGPDFHKELEAGANQYVAGLAHARRLACISFGRRSRTATGCIRTIARRCVAGLDRCHGGRAANRRGARVSAEIYREICGRRARGAN